MKGQLWRTLAACRIDIRVDVRLEFAPSLEKRRQKCRRCTLQAPLQGCATSALSSAPLYNEVMFFRRERPKMLTVQDRIATLRSAGFTVNEQSGSLVRAVRGDCAADLNVASGTLIAEGRAGILVGGEIGVLVDGGYQKFFRTPNGIKKPATAQELVDLHNFEEDLRESLGLTSLYNESLGTVSTYYQYDRVQDRDRGVPKRAWE
jgi:hypothetical protein